MKNREMKSHKAAISTSVAVVAIIIIVAIGGVLAYYYYTTTSAAAQPQTIKIGLIAPYSLAEGQDMDRAARLAVQEINNAGGIYVQSLGKSLNVTLVTIDTGSADPAGATTALEQALSLNNLTVLIGGYSSAETMATEVVAIQNNLPFIVTGASSKLVTTRTDYNTSFIFHYCTTTNDYARTIAHFFNDVMKPMVAPDRNFSLAILYRDDAYGNGALNSTIKFINSDHLNITIVDTEKFSPGATDFKTQLEKIKAASPDAVLMASFIAETSQIIIQGQQDVGLNTTYMALENNDEPTFFTNIAIWGNYQLLESKYGAYAGFPYYLPTIDTYVTKFEAMYNGTIPGNNGATTYDAFYIAKNAIERAGSLDNVAIRNAIETTNMSVDLLVTQSGRIQFSLDPATYHEINGVTFIQQLYWNATLSECRPKIVYPLTPLPGIGFINQTTFQLPPGYLSGGP